MRRVALFLCLGSMLALMAGCGDMLGGYANTVQGDVAIPSANGPNPNNLPDPNAVPKPRTPQGYAVSLSPVTIEEILIDPTGADAGNQYVELYNSSQFDADLGGWVLSNGTDTFTFGYGFKVPSSGRVLVRVAASGNDTLTEQFAPSFRVLNRAAGSLALMRTGNELVDFVQWGTAGNPFEFAAAVVGEWAAGDFVATAAEGASIQYNGSASNSSAWHEGACSPGN